MTNRPPTRWYVWAGPLLLSFCLVLWFFLVLTPCQVVYGADPPNRVNPGPDQEIDASGGQEGGLPPASNATAETGTHDEYGNVTEEETPAVEGPRVADPIEPWNRAMYRFNDKLYFWLLKPTAQGYKYVVPEGFRVMISSFYENLKAPIRIVNNLLQGKPASAGCELSRFLINSTVGLGGFKDCAKECFGMTGRDADFGQTLGKYGLGFGIYIVWPFLGPSSARDTVGTAGDWLLDPTSYVGSGSISPEGIGLKAHERVNYTSLHIGGYETLKKAAIDPYVAMRDAYVQFRKKRAE
jgi:phospholipid-binding lipoprotein MlaA